MRSAFRPFGQYICGEATRISVHEWRRFPSLFRRLYSREWLAPDWQPRCHWCEQLLNADTATLDHVHPKALGGPDTKDNLVPACRKCNEHRGMETSWFIHCERSLKLFWKLLEEGYTHEQASRGTRIYNGQVGGWNRIA